MFDFQAAFSGFSVDDLKKAQTFYTKTLGVKVEDTGMGLMLHLPHGARVFIYLKSDHQPASYTMLNFAVENIDEAVKQLESHGVKFEKYEGAPQDEHGIARGLKANMGPDIAWFKDPAGNILAVLQDK